MLPSLRIIPNMELWRPCDRSETAVAWARCDRARERPDGAAPHAPGLPRQPRTRRADRGDRRGGYMLMDCEGTPELIVIATGSEVGLAVEAARELRRAASPRACRVDAVHQRVRRAGRGLSRTVLPRRSCGGSRSKRRAPTVVASYVGPRGAIIGMDTFGASGAGKGFVQTFRVHARERRCSR